MRMHSGCFQASAPPATAASMCMGRITRHRPGECCTCGAGICRSARAKRRMQLRWRCAQTGPPLRSAAPAGRPTRTSASCLRLHSCMTSKCAPLSHLDGCHRVGVVYCCAGYTCHHYAGLEVVICHYRVADFVFVACGKLYSTCFCRHCSQLLLCCEEGQECTDRLALHSACAHAV